MQTMQDALLFVSCACVLRAGQCECQNEKTPLHRNGVYRVWCLAVSYSHMGSPTLPSALTRFTSEFGMGSGGTTLPLPPGKFGLTT